MDKNVGWESARGETETPSPAVFWTTCVTWGAIAGLIVTILLGWW